MTIEEAYEKSRLAKAVEEAMLGHVFLQNQNAVMIHDTDYTSEAKTDAEKAEMRDWVKQIMEGKLQNGMVEKVTKILESLPQNAGKNDVIKAIGKLFGVKDSEFTDVKKLPPN